MTDSNDSKKIKDDRDESQPANEAMHLRLEEQLTRTMKFTGQTNQKLMEVLGIQAQNATTSLKLQSDFYETQQANLLKENRYRRWKIFLFLSPLVLLLLSLVFKSYQEYAKFDTPEGYVAQVSITGTIQQGSSTAGSTAVIAALRKAFADEKAKGVMIRISSGGGSPTQSHMIHDEIIRLQELHPEKKISLIGEEMLTSGAYWIASAVDKIAVMETTYVGSVGVITTQFNFSGFIDKLGIDRLVITAGESKSTLDQFQPPKEKDIQKMRDISSSIHETFIKTMLESRGDKFTAPPAELFTGNFWMGEEAVALGLVDEIITPTRLMLRDFGTVKYIDYSKRPSFIETLGIAKMANIINIMDEFLTAAHSEMNVQAN